MNSDSRPKYWEKTRLNNLVRHAVNKRFYARLYTGGKEVWRSLKTTHFSIAEAKLAELQKEHRKTRHNEVDPGNAKMTFGQVAGLHVKRLEERPTIKGGTKKYWREIHAAVLKSWPELSGKEVRRITPDACHNWANRYAKAVSDNRYNNSVSFLRHVFDLAIELSVIPSNPAASVERVAVRGKKLHLPSLAQFVAFIEEMRRGGARDSRHCADLAEGLAYTGMRIGEAGEVVRGDVDLKRDQFRVAGDPEEATKNGEVRYVPLIPQARALFERMLAERPDADRTAKLFEVSACQRAMNRAAAKIGMARVTHHDLRHFFATVCIESGVDIPTVSRWLGHKDGGVLAMKTYGHLRNEHSIAQAKKVSFVPAAA
ncbi:MAG: site-specific integrase [Chthoniobacteraceae bacterium]